MDLPAYLRAQDDGIYLSVKIQPRAKANSIQGTVGSELRIRVTAPPVDSAANEALVEFLAETLNCPRGSVQLVRGGTSRHKLVRVTGISSEVLAAKLAEHG